MRNLMTFSLAYTCARMADARRSSVVTRSRLVELPVPGVEADHLAHVAQGAGVVPDDRDAVDPR